MLINDGSGVFTDESADRLDPTVQGDAHRAAVGCDVDGDGNMDIVQAINGSRNRLLMNDGTGRYHDEAAARGFPSSTGFSHDVECEDYTGDGRPELLFARRDSGGILYLVNDGTGHFTDDSGRFGSNDTVQELALCDLDADGVKEVLMGNGDIVSFQALPNRVLRRDPATGNFVDASSLGFRFAHIADVTEDIECGDLDGNGNIDAVVIGNVGLRNWLYLKQTP
jgi:hypothetical protein